MKKGFLLQFIMLLIAFVGSVGTVKAAEKTSTLVFTKACGGSGTADDGVKWTVTSDGNESNYDTTYGIHYGTNKASVSYLQLSTNGISGTIKKVVVNARDALESAYVSVKVGGNDFGEAQKASNTSTDYTFTGSASGEIIVRVGRGESMTKAIYVKSIVVTYDDGSNLELPEFEYSTEKFTYFTESENTLPTLTNNSDGEVTYSSSNTEVATIDENGNVSIQGNGTTTITAEVAATSAYTAATASYVLQVVTVEDGVFDFTIGYDYESGVEQSTVKDQESTWTAGNVTMKAAGRNCWYTSNDFRLYVASGSSAAGTLVFTAPEGKVITEIVFDDNAKDLKANVGTYDNAGKWTGVANSVEFEATATVKTTKITVIYGDVPTVSVSVGETGFATLASDIALDFTNSEIKAYKASVSGENITLTKVDKVAAGEGVLVYYADGAKTEDIPAATETVEASADNAFVGALEEIASLPTEGENGKNYILSIVNGKVGFYQAAGKKVAAGKAYLSVPATGAKEFYMVNMENAVVTGINEVNTEKADNAIYNLNGVRVKDMSQKGVYIVNGKKVVKK